MTLSVENIINQALDDVGYPKHIGSIYEGSPAARVALEIYGQTRDELFDSLGWPFTRRVAALALLKGPPPDGGYSFAFPWTTAYPMPGFLYEYTYPTDCIDLRAIMPPPGSMPDLDPVPALWRIDNDPLPVVTMGVAAGPPAKVILCNTTNALAVYQAKVTDPNLWEPGFIAALVKALAVKLGKALGAPVEAIKEETGEAVVTGRAASEVRG